MAMTTQDQHVELQQEGRNGHQAFQFRIFREPRSRPPRPPLPRRARRRHRYRVDTVPARSGFGTRRGWKPGKEKKDGLRNGKGCVSPPVVPNDARCGSSRSCSSWPGSCALESWPRIPPRRDPGQDQDVQVLTRGPVHEAFAVPVVHDPEAGPDGPQAAPRAGRGDAPRPEARAGRTSSGSPATGAGTTAATTSSGSAASGASRRRAGSGCRATGTR